MDKELSDEQLLQKALEIANEAHTGQTDKAGAPYIEHPKRVASKFSDIRRKIVALLHDVVEDTDVSLTEIEETFGREIALDISALTKNEGEDYMDFVRRAATREVSRDVKIEDIRDNSNLERLSKVTDEDLKRLKKYESALEILLSK